MFSPCAVVGIGPWKAIKGQPCVSNALPALVLRSIYYSAVLSLLLDFLTSLSSVLPRSAKIISAAAFFPKSNEPENALRFMPAKKVQSDFGNA